MNKCDILSLMSKSERITVAGYFNVSNTRKTLDIHFFPLMLIQFSFKPWQLSYQSMLQRSFFFFLRKFLSVGTCLLGAFLRF